MQRHPTTQDVTWFLDLHASKQLDLDPPYQRRSVWSTKDRQFFLDTVFRGYPSPAIYLAKEIRSDGTSVYHVIDGKQRLETVLLFHSNKLRVAPSYGDTRLDGKLWRDIKEPDLKKAFWDYRLPVELVNDLQDDQVNNIFDRLNRNSLKLEAQELRHAKYEGWFIDTAEKEAAERAWVSLGVATRGRARRMRDVQFLSELLLVVIQRKIQGFSQLALDAACATYSDTEDVEAGIDYEQTYADFVNARQFLASAHDEVPELKKHLQNFGNCYSLWGTIVLSAEVRKLSPKRFADKTTSFLDIIKKVLHARRTSNISREDVLRGMPEKRRKRVEAYETYLHGAYADIHHRTRRHDALLEELLA